MTNPPGDAAAFALGHAPATGAERCPGAPGPRPGRWAALQAGCAGCPHGAADSFVHLSPSLSPLKTLTASPQDTGCPSFPPVSTGTQQPASSGTAFAPRFPHSYRRAPRHRHRLPEAAATRRGRCRAPGGLSPADFSGFHTAAAPGDSSPPAASSSRRSTQSPPATGAVPPALRRSSVPAPERTREGKPGPCFDSRGSRPSRRHGAAAPGAAADKLSRWRGVGGRRGGRPSPAGARALQKGGRASGRLAARYLSCAVAGAVPEPPHHGADRNLLLQQQLQNSRHSRLPPPPSTRTTRGGRGPAPAAAPSVSCLAGAGRRRRQRGFPPGRRAGAGPARAEPGRGRAPSPCQHAGHGAPALARARLFLSCAVFASLAGLGARPSRGGACGLGRGKGQRRPPRLRARPPVGRRQAGPSPARPDPAPRGGGWPRTRPSGARRISTRRRQRC